MSTWSSLWKFLGPHGEHSVPSLGGHSDPSRRVTGDPRMASVC